MAAAADPPGQSVERTIGFRVSYPHPGPLCYHHALPCVDVPLFMF